MAEQNVVDARGVWLLGDADPLQALCIEPACVSIHAIRDKQVRFAFGDHRTRDGTGRRGEHER